MAVVACRQKKSDGGVFLEAVQAAIRAARPAGVPVIVNDRVDVALAAGADGVHVGQGDIPCSEARLPPLLLRCAHAWPTCMRTCVHALRPCTAMRTPAAVERRSGSGRQHVRTSRAPLSVHLFM